MFSYESLWTRSDLNIFPALSHVIVEKPCGADIVTDSPQLNDGSLHSFLSLLSSSREAEFSVNYMIIREKN
jgi:hypothetical protein